MKNIGRKLDSTHQWVDRILDLCAGDALWELDLDNDMSMTSVRSLRRNINEVMRRSMRRNVKKTIGKKDGSYRSLLSRLIKGENCSSSIREEPYREILLPLTPLNAYLRVKENIWTRWPRSE